MADQIAVKIAPLNIKRVKIKIKGKTPLLMDRMTDEVKDQILQKQMGISQTNKTLRDIEKEQKDAIHYTNKKKIGFPASGFKSGMIESTSFVGGKMFSKKLLKGVQLVNAVDGLIVLAWKKQDILKHTIGINTKYSPQFHKWTCTLEIEYDANNISATDIVTLLDYSGYYYGIGIWSPRSKCGGSFGMYETTKS